MNFGGRNHAAAGVNPPQQGFGGENAPLTIDLHLVIKFQFLTGNSDAQFGFQRGANLQRRLHVGIEEADGVASGSFGFIHGHVGALEQFVVFLHMPKEQADADAGGAQIIAGVTPFFPVDRLERIGPVDRVADFFGHSLGLGGGQGFFLVQILQHDDELIAAQSCHGIAVAYARPEAVRHFHQQQIADVVPLGVVEGLEVIQVEEHQRAMAAVAGAAGLGLAETVEQQTAVGQLRQRIVEGEVADLILCFLALGDVGEGADVMRNVSFGVRYGCDE